MKFSQVSAWRIPSGSAQRVRQKHNGNLLWEKDAIRVRYVSLGDSIAAGHTINGDWASNYGEGSQYGKNGNTKTAIVPNCYTDLIHNDLSARYGGGVETTSFARSGDTVADLMAKLEHDVVKNTIARAHYVTVCIGANDVLQPAMMYFEDYINGDMSQMNATIDANLARLANDSDPNSFRALFNKLYSINPDAQYVFTTIYNPYKYLFIEQSTSANDYTDGFLGPVMWGVPSALRGLLLDQGVVRNFFEKINAMPERAEGFVTRLNDVIKSKVAAFGKANFIVADTKAVFDVVPDREVSSSKHYNDLVNVEFTRGYNVNHVDWGEFWANLNYADILGNLGGIMDEVMDVIINDVVVPDVDPHPEAYGHHAMRQAFADAMGWISLPRRTITYNAGTYGIGTMASQEVIVLDGMTPYTNLKANEFASNVTGVQFVSWSDGASSYTNGQFIVLGGNLSLTAQWSDIFTVTVRHSYDVSSIYGIGDSDTGPQENYALWIDGVEQPDLGKFSNPPRVYNLPYGTNIGVIAQVSKGSGRSYVMLNGVKVNGNSSDARYGLTVTGNIDIHFEWNYWTADLAQQSYWLCYITTQ